MFICTEEDRTIVQIFQKFSETECEPIYEKCNNSNTIYCIHEVVNGLFTDEVFTKKTQIFCGYKEGLVKFLDSKIEKQNIVNIKKLDKNEKITIDSKQYTLKNYVSGLFDIVDNNVTNSQYDLCPDLNQFKNMFDYNLELIYEDEKVIKYKCVDLNIKIKNFSGSVVEKSNTFLDLGLFVEEEK